MQGTRQAEHTTSQAKQSTRQTSQALHAGHTTSKRKTKSYVGSAITPYIKQEEGSTRRAILLVLPRCDECDAGKVEHCPDVYGTLSSLHQPAFCDARTCTTKHQMFLPLDTNARTTNKGGHSLLLLQLMPHNLKGIACSHHWEHKHQDNQPQIKGTPASVADPTKRLQLN